ncbi:MAG: YjbQ family protein [Nitrospira sp.]|nr:YjbQ family protein [bacterium]MBL7048968.1 YjbQ family protein [Nitrospira sp.]
MTKTYELKTTRRSELIDIKKNVQDAVKDSGINSGICYIYVLHTTAGVTINEGADPDVAEDIERTLGKLIPHSNNYTHMEGNSDSHIKTSLMGPSQAIIIEDGRLILGTWQSIFFCEFDGPRNRKFLVKIIKG